MSEPISPTSGWGVLHLFCKPTAVLDREAVVEAAKSLRESDHQLVVASMLGHKCDAAFMVLGPDLRVLRRFQSALAAAGLQIVDSYVSLTEVSEYAKGLPAEMVQSRLYPQLPPPNKPAFCFYPMSKRRAPDANWFTLPYEERLALMHDHGKSGRTFAGRITQLITGSTGVDDFEWGVTLFGVHPDDLKDVVYTMRFDEASAKYAEFGSFYVGFVMDVEELAASL